MLYESALLRTMLDVTLAYLCLRPRPFLHARCRYRVHTLQLRNR
jgi:hypothetical protein